MDDDENGPNYAISRQGNTIFFTGIISPISTTLLKRFCYQVYKEDYPWLNIFIQSSGGDGYSGYSIYDHIKTFPIPVNTIADGEAMSAATLIHCAGTKRFMMPNAVYLIHQGSYGVAPEKYRTIKDDIYNWGADEHKATGIYLAEASRGGGGGLPMHRRFGSIECDNLEECIRELLTHDIELNADETIDLGLADSIWDGAAAKEFILK